MFKKIANWFGFMNADWMKDTSIPAKQIIARVREEQLYPELTRIQNKWS